MNFRLTAILFGTILVVGVALLILSFGDDKQVSTDILMEELAAIKPDQIDTVEIEREDGSKLKLTKTDRWEEEWEISTPSGKQTVKAKADPLAVTELIGALLKAKPTTSSELTSNLAVHGLQPAGLKVVLRQGSERSSTINFGDVTIGGSKAIVFVTTSTRPSRPLAVSRSSIEALFRTPGGSGKAVDLAKWAPDFRVKSVFGINPIAAGDDTTAITLSYKNKKLELNKVGGTWKFVSPAGWGDVDPSGDQTAMPGTFTGARPLLGALTSLQAMSAADFIDNPSQEDLVNKYGLSPANPDVIRVELKNKDKETTVAFIGKKDATPTPPAHGGVAPQGKVWVRVEGEPGVIRANSGDLSGLAAIVESPDPLRDRTLLATEKSRIDGLDIVIGSQTAKLRKAGAIPEWKLFGNAEAGDPQPTNRVDVDKLLDAITEHRTIKSLPPANPANFAPADIKAEVKIWADGFEPGTDPKAEPKEKGKPTILLYGKKEGDSIFVRRTLPDGTVGEFLLSDKYKDASCGEMIEWLPLITKTRLDLLDKSLKTFSPAIANKITVSGVKNYDLDKEEKKTPSSAVDKERWVIAAPADQKGKTADAKTVAEMLNGLLGQAHSVSRFVDETPSPAKLIEYGLAPPAMPPPMSPPAPRLKVTIGLKGTDAAEKERIYEFGSTAGEFVYARQAGKIAVFTLPKSLFDTFANADLRDHAIFKFDPAQITGIELKGWKGNAGFVTDLHFEKNKEGVWSTTKSPGPYAVDPKKIEAFLAVLNATTVKAFLTGGPASEHGFADDKVALGINLKTANGLLIALTLGAPTDAGASYYAWTNVLPQAAPVFTVDATQLKVYKEGSGVFAK